MQHLIYNLQGRDGTASIESFHKMDKVNGKLIKQGHAKGTENITQINHSAALGPITPVFLGETSTFQKWKP